MTCVLPHLLWVGHAGDARDYRQVLAAGIRAVVQLAAEEPPLLPPRELICCRFPLVDGPGNSAGLLALALRTVVNLLETQVPTLLCCGAGMSRSPALAAAALARLRSQPLAEALAEVARLHPVDVAPGFWAEVQRESGPGC
jgi:protein-tyrosine phosphatase